MTFFFLQSMSVAIFFKINRKNMFDCSIFQYYPFLIKLHACFCKMNFSLHKILYPITISNVHLLKWTECTKWMAGWATTIPSTSGSESFTAKKMNTMMTITAPSLSNVCVYLRTLFNTNSSLLSLNSINYCTCPSNSVNSIKLQNSAKT